MNLNDLVAASPAKHYKKILEGHFGHRINVDTLDHNQAGRLLRKVRGLISECKQGRSSHYNERDASYLKLMVVEQALMQCIYENTTVTNPATGSATHLGAPTPAQQQQMKSQQMQAVQKIKDPKLQTAMKKSVSGQSLSKDEQQTVTGAMMGSAVAEDQNDDMIEVRVIGNVVDTLDKAHVDLDGIIGRQGKHATYFDVPRSKVDQFVRELKRGGGLDVQVNNSQVNELSKDTLKSYAKKASKDRGWQGVEAGASGSGSREQKAAVGKMKKRQQGVERAIDKLANESKRTRRLSESEVQQAQVILASQDLVDQVQKMIEECTSIQFKDLPALVNQIKNEIGYDQAVQFNSDASAALSTLVQSMQGSKQQLEAAVGVVTGQQASVPMPQANDLGAAQPAGGADMDLDVDMDFEEPTTSPDQATFGRERVSESRHSRKRR